MRSRTSIALLLLLVPALALAAGDPVALARAARYDEIAARGVTALAPLLDAYPTSDRETRAAILLAIGSMNVKSTAAKTVLDADVDGEDSTFQDLHRYALQAVDPEIRSTDLYAQVVAEGVALDPELGRGMYATLLTTYDDCDARLSHARHYVDGLAASDPKARYAAIVSLRILTGASHAYHPWASAGAREDALRTWHRWLRRLEHACRG